MADWDSGITFDSGARWDSGPTPPIIQPNNPKPRRSTMKRQPYFPRAKSELPEWYSNYATQLPIANATLALPPASVDASVADALFLEYTTGIWLIATREFGPAATASVKELSYGTGGVAHVLPGFSPPALPTGVVAVIPGAQDRISHFVQSIKAAPAYTESIGLQLGVVGSEDATENPLPTFTAKVERIGDNECVRIAFRKYGRDGVVIHSKRGGDGNPWEMLAIDLSSPYLDQRPLMVTGQPETREYRLQYYEDASPVGDFTDVASVVVGP